MALIQSISEYVTDGTVTLGSNVTAGNLLVTDLSGNSTLDSVVTAPTNFVQTHNAVQNTIASAVFLKSFYRENAPAGATTITIGGVGSVLDPGMRAAEYSNIVSSGSLDAAAFVTGASAGTANITASFTPAAVSTVHVTFADETVGQASITPTAPYATVQQDLGHVDHAQYATGRPASAQTSSFTLASASADGVYAVNVFKEAGGGGGPVVKTLAAMGVG